MITVKFNFNVRYDDMSTTIRFVLQSGIYWPILFVAYFFMPYLLPNELWVAIHGWYAITAFISACFLTLFYYSAIEQHFNERESEYNKKITPLDTIASDFGLLYSEKDKYVWQQSYADIWNRLYVLICRKNS